LSEKPGLHRFFWDMHGTPLPDITPQYPMTAIPHKTAPEPTAPWVVAGDYSVVLTAGGKSLTQPLPLKMDPRVQATTADLQNQFESSKALYDLRAQLKPIGKPYQALVGEVAKAKERARENPLKERVAALGKQLEAFANPANVRAGDALGIEVLSKVEKLLRDLQDGDAAPTPAQEAALSDLQRDTKGALEQWRSLQPEVADLNSELQAAGIEAIKVPQ
ncbi:MAG: hypothetical protein ABIR38_00115, partial [Chthoniobacterales bacterium]